MRETSYPYDLDSNMEAVLAGLEANGIDPASARAARVGLDCGDNISGSHPHYGWGGS